MEYKALLDFLTDRIQYLTRSLKFLQEQAGKEYRGSRTYLEEKIELTESTLALNKRLLLELCRKGEDYN